MSTVKSVKDKLNEEENKKDQIVIVDSALDVIKMECKKWKSVEKECSGSLIGKYREGKCFVLYAIRTGYFADQGFGGVSTDSDYQNRVFDILLAKYPKAELMYLGDYHLHPMHLPTLSGTDKGTSCEILADPKHQNLPKLVVLLATYCNGQQEIYPYLISRNEINNGHGQISIRKTKLYGVESGEPFLKGLLKREYVNIDSLTGEIGKGTSLAVDKTQEETLLDTFYETPFYKVPVIRKRFKEEIDKIAELFHVDITPTYIENGAISVEFKVKGVDIHIIFPKEYPLNAPSMFFGCSQGELFEFCSRRNWNSLSSCVDLLEELFEKKGGGSYEE